MAVAIDPLTQRTEHPRYVVRPSQPNPGGQAGVQTTSQSSSGSTTLGPSFSAIFAANAAAATAAGTTAATTVGTTPAITPAAVTSAASTGATSVTTPSTSSSVSSDQNDPAGPLFGPNPWVADPTGYGPNGVITHYNPVYFATQQTAETVAQMLGGTVVPSVQITTAPGSPFQQNQLNLMVQLPNGGLINPGFIADLYTHNWPQPFINQQIAAEVAGATPATAT
jgi:hypothetical protein